MTEYIDPCAEYENGATLCLNESVVMTCQDGVSTNFQECPRGDVCMGDKCYSVAPESKTTVTQATASTVFQHPLSYVGVTVFSLTLGVIIGVAMTMYIFRRKK